MKVQVDKDTCISCGLCIDICPNVFEYDSDDKSQIIDGCNCDEYYDDVLDASGACPVQAIIVEETAEVATAENTEEIVEKKVEENDDQSVEN